jgi:hypothetical protein
VKEEKEVVVVVVEGEEEEEEEEGGTRIRRPCFVWFNQFPTPNQK